MLCPSTSAPAYNVPPSSEEPPVKHYADPEWTAWLLVVGENPADDLPRLAAADWLDERGDSERAEYIRLQCSAEDRPAPEILWKIRKLENSLNGQLWAVEACPNLVTFEFAGGSPTLASLSVQHGERVRFRRGFPDAVSCPASDWLAHGSGIVPRQPIQTLRLRVCSAVPIENWWEMLPTLQRIEHLEIAGHRSELVEFLRKQGLEIRLR